MAKGKVFTGARAKLMIHGQVIGYATNVAGSEEIEYQPVEVLDNIEVDEFVPVAYRVTFTASFVRIVGDTLKGKGFFPETGKNPAEHLSNILNQGDMTCVIQDTKENLNIMTLIDVKVQSQNFTVNARGIVGEDVTFVAKKMLDESEAT